MDERLKNGLRKLINTHFAAVQTDTELGLTDNDKLISKAKRFWNDYEAAGTEFRALLEKCTVND